MPRKHHYVIAEASARVPSSCWGRYRRIAVVAVPPHVAFPSAIDERRRDVIEIDMIWERLHVGKTDRDAYTRGYRAAQERCKQLNRLAYRRLGWPAPSRWPLPHYKAVQIVSALGLALQCLHSPYSRLETLRDHYGPELRDLAGVS